MNARYSREIVGDRHCLYLNVNGTKHLISTSRVLDCSAPFGPTLQTDVQPAPAAPIPAESIALPEAPSTPRHVKITLFNLRKSVAAAQRRCKAPLAFPPAKSRGHLAFHDGREFVLVGRTVHSGPSATPIGANGFRRGLRPFGSLAAYHLWARRNGLSKSSPRASQRVVSAI